MANTSLKEVFLFYNLNMKNIIERLINNKKIYWASPSSITLIQWYSNIMSKDWEDFYSGDNVVNFHEKSIMRKNSKKHYLDFNNIEIIDNNDDGRYFDDLSFTEEKNEKQILKDFSLFFKFHLSKLDGEIVNKFLWIINEIERNVRNHAYEDGEEKTISYSANINSRNNDVILKINITDYGMGFEGRRNKNESFSILEMEGVNDAEHYLLEATKPGISTKTNFNKVSNEGSKNSGYGLYMLNFLASDYKNEMEIISDGKLFENKLNHKKLEYSNYYSEFEGITSISFNIAISTLEKRFIILEKEQNSFSNKSNYSKSKLSS